MRKRKSITDTVSPAILKRATQSRKEYNAHLDALRESGYTIKGLKGSRTDGVQVDVKVGAGISIETATLMSEAADIISQVEGLKDG